MENHSHPGMSGLFTGVICVARGCKPKGRLPHGNGGPHRMKEYQRPQKFTYRGNVEISSDSGIAASMEMFSSGVPWSSAVTIGRIFADGGDDLKTEVYIV